MTTLDVKSPFDNRIIKTVKYNTLSDAKIALNLAYDTFNDYKQHIKKYKRVEILKNVIKIMQENENELINLCASEGGKPWIDSSVEVQRGINGVELAIEAMSNMNGKEIAMGHTLSSTNRIAYTMHEPIGVVIAISAFNHPFNLAIHQIIPAIAVGCPVIIKPATQTPLSAMKIIEILYQAGLPKAWAQVIICNRDVGEFLVKSQKISFLTFIGSANVGWHLSKVVANGTRVALEHGGVAPVIVEADANINELIQDLGKGGFYHAGQVCVSVQRVYVQEKICNEVCKKLANYASNLKVGDQLDPSTQVGPLINNNEVLRVEQWVNDAKKNNAQIIIGGNKISDSCYEPTIILNPSDNDLVSTKEIFGPVVCIYTYKNINEAIYRANSLDVSFQAAIFTQNINTALYAVKRLNATAVMVNDHTAFRVDWMPFGGAKTSGIGFGGIHYSMDEMTNKKMMMIKSSSL